MNIITMAASILYIACKETKELKTQKDMAKASGVTEVTIRNRVRDLGKSLNSCCGNRSFYSYTFFPIDA
ncbi:MAG: hypothetical protein ACR2IS_10100 [Nitrososphaeraceae archaeon]